jgi:hypothetical protein
MPDDKLLPAILSPTSRSKLLELSELAGQNHLSPAQTALLFGLSEKETQILMWQDSEVCAVYAKAHLKQQMDYLEVVKEIANDSDPENKQRFPAAKYLYELFSGHKTSTTFNISIQNNHPAAIKTESSLKLVEAIDAETLEKIAND